MWDQSPCKHINIPNTQATLRTSKHYRLLIQQSKLRLLKQNLTCLYAPQLRTQSKLLIWCLHNAKIFKRNLPVTVRTILTVLRATKLENFRNFRWESRSLLTTSRSTIMFRLKLCQHHRRDRYLVGPELHSKKIVHSSLRSAEKNWNIWINSMTKKRIWYRWT